jgi:hypothetical protein
MQRISNSRRHNLFFVDTLFRHTQYVHAVQTHAVRTCCSDTRSTYMLFRHPQYVHAVQTHAVCTCCSDTRSTYTLFRHTQYVHAVQTHAVRTWTSDMLKYSRMLLQHKYFFLPVSVVHIAATNNFIFIFVLTAVLFLGHPL